MGINVLSLFDGMSCGQIALERAGIEVDNYYASEIKEHAIGVTQKNYPNTIQVGDITALSREKLPTIDLLIGGSPCQDFSFGNKNITGLNGIKSSLFYHYLRLKNSINPTYFLLENVRMKKEHAEQISDLMGVDPISINSSTVSGALRNRMYWTNIPLLNDIKDNGITLQSCLSHGYTDRLKARCLLESDSRPLTTPVKMFHRYFATGFTTLIFKDEAHYLACKHHYLNNYKGLHGSEIKCDSDVYNGVRYLTTSERERLQTVPVGYCENLTRDEASCLLGDGWTVDVIAHIFSYLNK